LGTKINVLAGKNHCQINSLAAFLYLNWAKNAQLIAVSTQQLAISKRIESHFLIIDIDEI
jgi:hypothetical protein